ncbi:MAG: inositol monophosphatase family protein [Arenicellales bacterium]
MKNSEPSLDEVCKMVVSIAKDYPGLKLGGADVTKKNDGSYVTKVDQDLQDALEERMQKRWPKFGFIGEEMDHSDQVLICNTSSNGYWVIDPLDGTTNFSSGFLCFGISVALVIQGQPRLAVIYDPVREECFSAEAGGGAFLNGTKITCNRTQTLGECIANVDYKRLVGELAERLVHSPPYRSQRNLGSSVLEWCWLAAGRVQLYLHGGQKLWDFAAGYLILTEAGGAATTLSGDILDCSSLKKRSVVAAVNPELLGQWSSWININRFDSDSPL